MSRTRRPDKRPPSRLRYEESHPVVTLRLPREVYDRFKEAIAATGASAASWVKEHLDQDDARAQAIAEDLAREKDGLGREIERRRRELASVDDLVNQRRDELAISLEAQRAKVAEEVAAERERLFESVAADLRLARNIRMGSLADLDADIAARKKELGRLIGDVAGQRMTLDLIERELSNREQLKERLVKEAVEQARRKGVPEVTCLFCGAYRTSQSLLDVALTVARALR